MKSKIWNLKSKIRNIKSKIWNMKAVSLLVWLCFTIESPLAPCLWANLTQHALVTLAYERSSCFWCWAFRTLLLHVVASPLVAQKLRFVGPASSHAPVFSLTSDPFRVTKGFSLSIFKGRYDSRMEPDSPSNLSPIPPAILACFPRPDQLWNLKSEI